MQAQPSADQKRRSSVDISDVTGLRETTYWQATVANQAFWVTVTVILLCLATTYYQPDTFATKANFFNITRNFAAIGIMAMGMTAVIITGGIDLSVGSVMAVAAVVAARVMEGGGDWYTAFAMGLFAGAVAGAINGSLIAYIKLPPFVVTLGMLSIARSAAIVLSENRVIYQFGPGGDTFKAIGGGQVSIPWIDGDWLPLSNVFVLLVLLAIFMAIMLKTTAWGRYLFAIGGNKAAQGEDANHTNGFIALSSGRSGLWGFCWCSFITG